jgi:hypothetical protein
MSAPDNFWSRRRAGVEAERRAEAEAEAAVLRAEEEIKLEERTDEELLAELNLPEPEAMETSEQVRSLLSSSVPQRLKTRALRRLWRIDPVHGTLDGLVDYGQDFSDKAMVVENMKTAYQVGKGMLKALEWKMPDPITPAEDDADDPQDAPDTQADTLIGHNSDAAPEEAETEALHMAEAEEDEPEPLPAPARRMRFRFETAT